MTKIKTTKKPLKNIFYTHTIINESDIQIPEQMKEQIIKEHQRVINELLTSENDTYSLPVTSIDRITVPWKWYNYILYYLKHPLRLFRKMIPFKKNKDKLIWKRIHNRKREI